jgi:hypothetical protein
MINLSPLKLLFIYIFVLNHLVSKEKTTIQNLYQEIILTRNRIRIIQNDLFCFFFYQTHSQLKPNLVQKKLKPNLL